MIGYDELKALTANAGELYPPPLDPLEHAWWEERGVDAEGLKQFCMEDAIDTATNILPAIERGAVSYVQLLTGGYAMSTHVGFILGWLAHEKATEDHA